MNVGQREDRAPKGTGSEEARHIELRGFSKGEEENGGFRGKGELEREESGAC